MQLSNQVKLTCSPTAPIVHVDDDEMLIKLVNLYYKKSHTSNPYISFNRGDEFLEYLHTQIQESNELPLIVLIDINMPGMNGFEVLKQLRSDSRFKNVPICSMLSSSSHPDDIEKSKELGADGYLVKPNNAKEYLELFEDLNCDPGE